MSGGPLKSDVDRVLAAFDKMLDDGLITRRIQATPENMRAATDLLARWLAAEDLTDHELKGLANDTREFLK